MNRVELYWQPWKVAVLMLAPVAVVWFGVDVAFYEIQSTSRLIVGSIAILIGGGLLVAYVWQVAHWWPRIVLDDGGIFDASLSTPMIPWRSITAMNIVPFQWTKLISLLLIDEEVRYAALPWWKKGRGFGYGPANVNLVATGVSTETLMAMMIERIEKCRLTNSGE